MPLRRLVVLSVTLCALVAACILIGPRLLPHRDAPAARTASADTRSAAPAGTGVEEDPAFAYTQFRDIVVMKGTRQIAKYANVFDPFNPYNNHVIWTASGRFVVFISHLNGNYEPTDHALIYIDAQTGAAHSIPCPYCWDVTSPSADTVLVKAGSSNDQNEVEQYNLGASAAPKTFDLPFVNTVGWTQFLASVDGLTLAYGTTSSSGGDLQLLSQNNMGIRDLGPYQDGYTWAAASPTTAYHGPEMAIMSSTDPGACASEMEIYLVDPVSVRFAATDTSAIVSRADVTASRGGMASQAIWWGSDGKLHATFASWRCDNTKRDESSKMIDIRESTPWVLEGFTWQQESTTVETAEQPLGSMGKLTLDIPSCLGPTVPKGVDITTYCNEGDLYLDGSGASSPQAKKLIAQGVISMSAPAT